jgi:uncharacterized protein (TIGR02246 family)
MSMKQPEDLGQAFEHAFNSGDLEAMLALYEPEATLIPEPGAVASGSEAIREAIGEFLGLKGQVDSQPMTTVTAGDVALASGPWTITGTAPDGQPVTMSGRSTNVLRRQPDGTWLLAIDVPFGIA